MSDNENVVTMGGLPVGQDVKTYLDQLEGAVKRAKDCLKTAEDVSQKAEAAELELADFLAKASKAQVSADSEALRANQAKLAVEEHSNTVAKLKGAMDADAAAIAVKRAEIEGVGQGFANLRSTSEADTTAVANARKTADEAVKAVTETSAKATAVYASIQEAKKDMEDLAQVIREETKGIKSDAAQIVASKDSSVSLLAAIQKADAAISEIQARSKTACVSVESLEKAANDKYSSVGELVKKSSDFHERVMAYEMNLNTLQAEFTAMKDKVERLLPGATSAGLASAFANQRKHYASEREKWAKIMVLGLGFLTLTVVVVGVMLPSGVADDWGAILRHFCQRFPYLVAPLWISGYAGHHHKLATRMEEEYASKETISTSFEGYKREMSADPEAAKALSKNVLEIIARRPGMVYEGKQQDVTPISAAMDAIEKLLPGTLEAIAAKLKGGAGR